ncbi:MAG: hemolysin family protein [Chromatiaceae bacterium]
MQELLILAILLVLSGIFSGSETALTSLSLARAQALHREGRRGATAVYRLKKEPAPMLIAILIGNNLVNVGASALATVVATDWFGHLGPGIAVGVITLLLLVFGEITPKSLATHYAERISLVAGPMLYAFMRAIYPLVWLFLSLTNLAHRLAGKQGDPLVTEAELISMVEHGEEEGTIEADEREMIERVFSLNDLRAEDVMTPRRRVFSLDGRRTLQDLSTEVIKEAYSRVPLHGDNPNVILKVLFARDLLEAVVTGRMDLSALEIGREPLFIPANQMIDKLLPLLRKHKQHMALVVDDSGYLEGVLTLEDILEEVVGEIYDESDEAPEQFETQSDGGILVSGHVELRVIEDYFDIEIPGKPTDRISHWILNHTARIPAKDESFLFDGMRVQIRDASQRHIRKVLISRIDDQPFQPNDIPQPPA